MKSFGDLVKNEELNDGYLPNAYDEVWRLPFVNSNKVDWQVGIVLGIWKNNSLPEALILTDTGKKVTEYCYYLYPSLTAGAENNGLAETK